MKVIDAIRSKARRLEINGIGLWDWSNKETVEFTSDTEYAEHKLCNSFCDEDDGWIYIYHPPGSHCVIGIYTWGHYAWRFCTDTGKMEKEFALFTRGNEDPGLRFVNAYACDTLLLLCYEGGVLLFEEDGKLRWHQDDFRPDCNGSPVKEVADTGIIYTNWQGDSITTYRYEDGNPL